MNRKNRIASALALACLLSASAPMIALAGSPLLSGYGGPGAGEQVLIGSTLLGGHSGGSGSSGSSASAESGAVRQSGPGATAATGATAAATGATAATNRSSSTSSGSGHTGTAVGSSPARSRAPRGGVTVRPARAGTSAFVYPSSLRSASAGSPALGISSGDLLVLLAALASLALVGVLTMRLSRLQR